MKVGSSWIHKSSLVAMGILTLSTVISGCGPNSTTIPLTLYIDPVTACIDEEIIVALDNPTMTELFIPAAWTGLAVYQKMVPETWSEYLYPDGFEPMFTTSDALIEYAIPAGTLEPGSYKLVLQGRSGKDGTPFSLEINLLVLQFTMAETGHFKGMGN